MTYGLSIRVPALTALASGALLATACPAKANDWEEWIKDGYAVVEETYILGEFEGCDFDKRIPLANGLIFVCSSYSYTYSYNPDVFILKHYKFDLYKVVIEDEEYDGTLYTR